MSGYDLLAQMIQAGIRICTHPCFCIEYTDNGKCSYCDGEGTTPPLFPPPKFIAGVAGVEVQAPSPVPCGHCEGSGVCGECKGTRQVVPEQSNASVVSFVCGSAIQSMFMLRKMEHFHEFNEMLDALHGWVMSIVQNADAPTQEQMDKILGVFTDDPPKPPTDGESSNALTPEELRELGINDAD